MEMFLFLFKQHILFLFCLYLSNTSTLACGNDCNVFLIDCAEHLLRVHLHEVLQNNYF